ncbi:MULTISPECIES: hypothetical protein [unclassified Mycobacterium]|uniref:hypothetical protein n=1 Tax=unclassified Mycobacterium TaxID=2642494 RepID=UPI0029C89C89|nr:MULTISPECIES: hypothetical protein [unclassified Mycobacterium]
MSSKPGTRLITPTSACEVLIVRASSTGEVLTCAGGELTPGGAAGNDTGTGPTILLGKRYADEASGLEVLCVKAGTGPLRLGDRELVVRAPKPLPASD